MKPIALITGGGRGIGAETAQLLAELGYDVCVNYAHNRESAEAVVDRLRKYDVKVIAVQADVGNEGDIVRLFETVDAQLGPVTALVNNAAIIGRQMTVADMSAARINEIFAVNVTGSFICCREAIKRMSKQYGGLGGAIVNVSSAAARLGSPGEYVDYAASKGAIDTLTLGLSKEVAEYGVRVNCVRPGVIKTTMHADAGEPDRVDRVKLSVPMGRGGEVREVAAAISWLLSDEASYTTGALLDVTGGR